MPLQIADARIEEQKLRKRQKMANSIIFTSRETEIRNKVELKVEAFDTTISKILSLQDFGGKQKHEQNMKVKL